MISPGLLKTRQRTNARRSPATRRSRTLSLREQRAFLIAGDVLILVFVAIFTLWFQAMRAAETEPFILFILWPVLLVPIWLLLSTVNECYNLTIASQSSRMLPRMVINALGTGAACMLAFVISAHLAGAEGQQQPYFAVGLFLLSTLLLTALWHTSYLALFNKQTRRRRILAVGTHDSARTLARAALHISSLYHVVGIVCDDQEQVEQEKAVASIPVLGNSTHLWYLVVSQEITDIIVESLPHDSEVLTRTLQICREHGVNVTGLAGFYEEIAGRVAIGQPKPDAPYDCQSRTTSLQAMIGERCRRFIDIMLALAGLALLLPTLPFIALAIYIDNPGPIFYRQERVGKGGKIFSLLKFRSMVTNAEQNGQAVWANSNDPRVTHVGMLLRSARIDELPQVLNVLKGDMSIVGPRPERPQFVEQLQEHISCYGVRHQVKPGLTGWAQVNYRYGSSVDDAFTKLEYDLYYLKHQSLLLDMLIVLRTFKVVLLMRGT